MPIQDYKCDTCHVEKEIIVPFSRNEVSQPCELTPGCKGTMTRPEISKCNWKPNKSFFNGGYKSN